MLFKSGNNDITAEGVEILLTNKWNKLKFLDLGYYLSYADQSGIGAEGFFLIINS